MLFVAPAGPLQTGGRWRRAASLAISATLHVGAIAWLAIPQHREPPPKTLYQQEIEPYRERIVWYNLRDKLPDLAPPQAEGDAKPPRTRRRAPQTLISQAPERSKTEQTIYLPDAPETDQELPSPNVVAVRERAPLRPFTPPPRPAPPAPAPLPEAPQTASASLRPAPVEIELTRPRPRDFTPPRLTVERPAQPTLPAAPDTAAVSLVPAPITIDLTRPRPRDFTPPKLTVERPAPRGLPDAPQTAAVSLAPAPVPIAPARPLRDFAPPKLAADRPAQRGLPDAPLTTSGATTLAPPPLAANLARPRPRDFTPPASAAAAASGAGAQLPAPSAAEQGQAVAVIVGLHPTLATEAPDPAAALRAGFSASPDPRRREGGDGAAPGAMLSVPGLLARGGARDAAPTLVARVIEAPTSARNLAEAARNAPRAAAADEPRPRQAIRVSSAPDRRLEGRIVYTIAVQMPNITSYSGSWIFWFAERQRLPGAPRDMRPPSPIRKVDPKYYAAAVDERREGKVRLAAVIRATGRVDTVSVIAGFDPRLDRSAAEALAKWEFEPAMRDGAPVDVDAVVEIPFRLAPRTTK
jgi:TonB family protein